MNPCRDCGGPQPHRGASFLGARSSPSEASLFGSILLDGGDIFRLCLAAVGVYWVAVLMGVILRRGRATTVDRVLLNVGYWPLAAINAVAQHLVWAIKGL